jgi:serine/threonine-protein kinase
MRGFEVLRVDPPGAPNGLARLRIALNSGETLEGSVGAGCDVFGYNDIGRFSKYLHDVARVDFVR